MRISSKDPDKNVHYFVKESRKQWKICLRVAEKIWILSKSIGNTRKKFKRLRKKANSIKSLWQNTNFVKRSLKKYGFHQRISDKMWISSKDCRKTRVSSEKKLRFFLHEAVKVQLIFTYFLLNLWMFILWLLCIYLHIWSISITV